jgi:hypothetical protein
MQFSTPVGMWLDCDDSPWTEVQGLLGTRTPGMSSQAGVATRTTDSMVSLLYGTTFTESPLLSNHAKLYLKEPYLATTLRLCSCYGFAPGRIAESVPSKL